jgi:dimeric dUTPase (all-alpha-NTP-PPase superfamily)
LFAFFREKPLQAITNSKIKAILTSFKESQNKALKCGKFLKLKCQMKISEMLENAIGFVYFTLSIELALRYSSRWKISEINRKPTKNSFDGFLKNDSSNFS